MLIEAHPDRHLDFGNGAQSGGDENLKFCHGNSKGIVREEAILSFNIFMKGQTRMEEEFHTSEWAVRL